MDFQILQRLCLNSARGSAGSDRSARSRRARSRFSFASRGARSRAAGDADRAKSLQRFEGTEANRLARGGANGSARSRSGFFTNGFARSDRFARGDGVARGDSGFSGRFGSRSGFFLSEGVGGGKDERQRRERAQKLFHD